MKNFNKIEKFKYITFLAASLISSRVSASFLQSVKQTSGNGSGGFLGRARMINLPAPSNSFRIRLNNSLISPTSFVSSLMRITSTGPV